VKLYVRKAVSETGMDNDKVVKALCALSALRDEVRRKGTRLARRS